MGKLIAISLRGGKAGIQHHDRAQIRLLRFELQTENFIFRIYQKRAELEEVLGGPYRSL